MSVASSARLLVLYLLFACMFFTDTAHADSDPLPRPVLGKEFVKRLLATETRSDAFYELILRIQPDEPRWKNLPRSVFDDAMEDIRVTKCPGRDGDAPLYLVTYKEDSEKWFDASHPMEVARVNGFKAEDFYPPTVEEQRHAEQWKAARGTPHLSKSSLNEPFCRPGLDDKVLIFIDTNGQVQWPHGGKNLGDKGSIIADLNGDGVLERLDYESYGFEDKRDKYTTFQVLEVTTIEKTPKILLAVVFNWHPNSAHNANRWWYEVKNMPDDTLPVIVLGPQPGEHEGEPIEKPVVEYHWDKVASRYIGPDGRQGDHFRRLDVTKPDEMWPKIQELRKEKNLGYQLLTEVPPDSAKKDAPAPQPGEWMHWPKYEHHTLATMSNEELFHWVFSGEPERDKLHDSWPPVVFPPNLRKLTPRDAALAFAEANRTKAHRACYDLIVLNESKPVPKDGVVVLDMHPGWVRSYQEFIRLNGKDAEWWMCTPLAWNYVPQWSHHRDTDGTLCWLMEVIGWLDRVRTVPRLVEQTESEWAGVWEDVTRAGIVWQTQGDDRKAVEYRCAEPQFAGRQWKGPYTRRVAQTLAVNLWMTFCSAWGEDEHARVPVEDAVKTLLPAKPRAFTGAERLMIKPAIMSVGSAGLTQFRPQLEKLAEGAGVESGEEQIVPASLQPFALAALNELDHREDIPTLKSWASDYKGLEGPWAGMRLRQIEEAATKPEPVKPEPQSAAIQNEAKPDETWEELSERYRAGFAKSGDFDPLEGLLKTKGDHLRPLWDLMKQKFDGAWGGFRDEIAAAYTADLRNVAQDDLSHLATASPEEEEGTRYNYWGGKNGGKPVDGRYHLARHILAVWQEPDALTLGKLLLLLGLHNADARHQIPGVFGDRLMNDLVSTAALLSENDRSKIVAFARWCDTDAVGRMDDYAFTKSQAEWLKCIMQKMKRK